MIVGSGRVRVWDSGSRLGSENMALDRHWLHQHALGGYSNQLRFHRYRPSVSVGRHQALDRELRLDYCSKQAIEVLRRPSSGGALYLDEQQLALSLIIRRPSAWRDWAADAVLESFCRALVCGLQRLGLDPYFKAPNDVEVNRRKLGSAFLAAEGDSLLLQAFLILGVDVARMLQALRVPTEKLSPTGLAGARQRLITLEQCLEQEPAPGELEEALLGGLSSTLGLRFRREGKQDVVALNAAPHLPLSREASEARRIDWSGSRSAALESLWRTPGGVLRARVVLDTLGKIIRSVEFATDMHLAPAALLESLQTSLANLPVALANARVADVVKQQRAELLGFSVEDLQRVLQIALDKFAVRQRLGLSIAQTNAIMLHGTSQTGIDVLERAQVMLVPYCAKPVWCKWRQLDGCSECGKCEVGDAYQSARERGMPVTSINNYEHLVATLTRMKAEGVQAYVGMCCSNFFIKRHRAFSDAGIPALLMDISGSNCYELQQEEQAYAGTFDAQSRLDTELLHKVMRVLPPRRRGAKGKT